MVEHDQNVIGSTAGGGSAGFRAILTIQSDGDGLLLVLIQTVAAYELELQPSEFAVAHTIQTVEHPVEISLADGVWLEGKPLVENPG